MRSWKILALLAALLAGCDDPVALVAEGDGSTSTLADAANLSPDAQAAEVDGGAPADVGPGADATVIPADAATSEDAGPSDAAGPGQDAGPGEDAGTAQDASQAADAAAPGEDASTPADAGEPDGGPMLAAVGEACGSDQECEGGTCLDSASGWPDGYCTHEGCNPGDPSSCAAYGGDGVCRNTSGSTYCMDQCSSPAECRTGYDCVAHTMSSVCEPGTTPTGSAIGQPCGSAADCLNDTCLGSADGWPSSGYCSQSGCSTSNPSSTCPTGSYCRNISTTGAPRPMCLDLCNTSGDSCANGFTCNKYGGIRVCEP